jgi:hypothetical protein
MLCWPYNRVKFQNMHQEFVVKLDIECLYQEIESLYVLYPRLLVLQCQIEVEKVLLLFYFGFRHVSLREYVLRVCDDGEQATLAYVVSICK